MKSLGLKFNKKKTTYLDYDKFPASTKRQYMHQQKDNHTIYSETSAP